MKITIALILTGFITSAFAQALPKEDSPCAWGSHCVRYRKVLDGIFTPPASLLNNAGVTNVRYPGVYYQRGEASNCNEAKEEAKEKLLFNHPEFECRKASNPSGIACEAMNIGPRLVGGSCMKSKSGKVVAWLKCDTTRDPAPKLKGDPGVGIILIKIAKEGERKARASR